MADFGGFSQPTPQEVLAKLADQRRAGMVGGNVVQQRSQNIETALDGLFGNPQVRAAKRMQTAMQNATPKQEDGEDNLDYELRRLKSLRDAVVDIDPATASKINEQLLQVGEQKFQRNRLTAGDAMDKQKFSYEIDKLKSEKTQRELLGGQTYVLNGNDGSAEAFDLQNPEETARFQEASKKPGHMIISPEQAFQLYHDKTIQAMKVREALNSAAGLSKVTAKDVEKASAGILDTYATADRLFQVLSVNKDVMTKGSAGAKELDKVATELASAGRILSGNMLKDGTSIDSYLKTNGITNERAQSLTIALAAGMAKANNPDGRISDADMRIAVNMVGGNNPNPAVVLSNLNDTLTRSSESLLGRIESVDGLSDMFAKRTALMRQKQESFTKKFSEFAQGQAGSSATGIDAQPDKDGWTTVNGVRIREKK